MLYTLTLNPSIDYMMQVDTIDFGATNYSEEEYMLPGGKGINVTRILNQLNVSNTALGFIGGYTGRFIEEWLTKEEATHHFIEVEGDTRINIKLKGESETEINGRGPIISEENSQKLFNQLENLTAEDTVVISGSKNRGLSETYYIDIIQLLAAKDVSFVIDTNSKELLEALKYRPLLVKPNQDELGDLFGVTIETVEDAIEYGQKLQEAGAQNVIVSLGGSGAVFIDENESIFAQAPQGQVVNTVGSGDSMIAGFMAGMEKGLSKVEAFILGVQSGSATAFNEDLANEEDITALNGQVVTRKVE